MKSRSFVLCNVPGKSWVGMPYTLYADGAVLNQGVLDRAASVNRLASVIDKTKTRRQNEEAGLPLFTAC